MLYRENGQFKTTYAADQQIFTITQDKWFVIAVIAFAFIGVPELVRVIPASEMNIPIRNKR